MRYGAYGLVFDSELELPELLAPDDATRAVDVHIRRGDVPAGGLPAGTQIGPFLWTHGNELWLAVEGVARFWVREGREIIVQAADIDEASVRVFLRGSAMGALLFQRGFLVLHGNAVRVGDSGAGKSTRAAGFLPH